MTLNQLQNSLEELQNKFPEYTDLITYMKFISMWFETIARDARRSCDQECRKMLCNLQMAEYCNYYDLSHHKCILEMMLYEQ